MKKTCLKARAKLSNKVNQVKVKKDKEKRKDSKTEDGVKSQSLLLKMLNAKSKYKEHRGCNLNCAKSF